MDRAVVLGGGMAGVLAARVLTDHATEVVLVERDDLSGGPVARRGVPQGNQVHGLLARGLERMESMFPGLTAELADAGAEVADPGVDLQWWVTGQRKPPSPIGPGVSCTRPFLEWHLRRRLTALSGVRIVQARAEALTATAGRVDGVLLAESGERLSADLVVDCTGRSTRMDEWLAALGYAAPPRRTVNVELGYATRFYPREPDDRLGDARAIISITEDYQRARGAVAFPAEGGRWIVTVGAYHDDRPRADAADFAERLRTDPVPAMHQFADREDALTDVTTFRYPASVRRDFHRLRRFPAGLVALGDSVASFNPLYGQGMTSAALQAGALAAYLGSGPATTEPATRYFRRLRPVVNSVWKLSTSADFRLSHVTGDRPAGLKMTLLLNDIYTKATLRDADLHGLFLRVLNLQTRPEQLARPDHLARALWVLRSRAPR
ncbi:MAG TPA: FAD-dependent oxidoreductase [Acidimicrobiales bacterium]|nr:FAD-dependent oxidoreductase [Acidimicrobiales bacterium]